MPEIGPPLPDTLDVAIVGAGFSGLVIGRLLADTDLTVAVLEQNYSIPGNALFAGLVTFDDMRSLGIDDLGRIPVREIVTIDAGNGWRPDPTRRFDRDVFTVVHHDLLEALQRKSLERGVPVLSDATVSELVWQNGRVSGLISGPGAQEIRCKLVVLADESDPRLAEAPGLRPNWPPTRLMHLAKERLIGSPKDIEHRFGAGPDGVRRFHLRWGTAWGDAVEAYVVPARESVTIGANLLLEDEMANARHVLEVLDELKAFPEIEACLAGLDGSDVVTEVIPRGRGSDPLRLVADGTLLANDVVGATNPLNRDGISNNVSLYAVAARVVQDALDAGNVSDLRLAPYQEFANETVFRPGRGPFGRGFPRNRDVLICPGDDVTFARISETLRGRSWRSLFSAVGARRRGSNRSSKT